MLHTIEADIAQARSAASRAAADSGVRVVDEFDMDLLRDIAGLLVAVWGTTHTAPPIPADLLRSISHAGCNTSAAYSADGILCGAAIAIVSPENASTYSLIAGVLPRITNAGVGFALKQHQRAWAITRGLTTMTWAFDPLVSRNARFNLTKLGAHASEYIQNFYGVMDDEINAKDESDRLVAIWPLTADQTVSCSDGAPEPVELPAFLPSDVLRTGPDGQPVLIQASGSLWCRVPADIVVLRGENATEAAAWRECIREIFTQAFAAEHTARGVTRTGWYRLAVRGQQ
ncbi:MAG: GNAT family N-acetyltransferase [Cryobacterium sp.]|nr:GNAT family N-acetyltransferase [Cryobacterium sp.]